MKIGGKQVTAARDLLGITQAELAEAVGMAMETIRRFEAGLRDPKEPNIAKIQAELERRGIEFTNGIGPGLRLNLAKAEEYSRSLQRPTDR